MDHNLLIDVRGLLKVYGEAESEVRALDGLDAGVARGEFVAIMGPSGSGKSTLMNILGCLDRPTGGAYILDGRDVSGLDKNELAEVRNQKIGFVFQSFNLLPRLTALRNVTLPLLYNSAEELTDAEAEARARAALESVGLGQRLHHRPINSPAASSNAWRSRARWSIARRCSWPMSRPAISTRARASRSWT